MILRTWTIDRLLPRSGPSRPLRLRHSCPSVCSDLPAFRGLAAGRQSTFQWGCMAYQQGTYSLKSVNILIDVLQNSF
jgi:hypothetical protein